MTKSYTLPQSHKSCSKPNNFCEESKVCLLSVICDHLWKKKVWQTFGVQLSIKSLLGSPKVVSGIQQLISLTNIIPQD